MSLLETSVFTHPFSSHPLIPLPQIRHPNSTSHPNYSCRIWGRTGGGSNTNHPRIPTTNKRTCAPSIRVFVTPFVDGTVENKGGNHGA